MWGTACRFSIASEVQSSGCVSVPAQGTQSFGVYAASVITFSSVSGLETSTNMLHFCFIWNLSTYSWTICIALAPQNRTEVVWKVRALWSQLMCFLCDHKEFRANVITERCRIGKRDRLSLNKSQAMDGHSTPASITASVSQFLLL